MNKEVVGSLAEMISLMLNDFDKNDEETQVRLVLQVIPFFQEIFSTISPNNQKNQQLHKASFSYFNACNHCLKSIVKDKTDLKTFSDFFDQFIRSCLVSDCAEPISQLIFAIVSLNNESNENLLLFTPPINSYFLDKNLRSEFIKKEGFSLVWATYSSENNNNLAPFVFEQLINYHQFFFTPSYLKQIENFFTMTSTGFKNLPTQKAHFLLGLFEKMASANISFFDNHFESTFGFNTISNYILDHQNDDFYKYIDYLLNLCQTDLTSKNKAIPAIITILCSESCQTPLRIRILESFKGFIINSNIKKQPFSSSVVDLILKSIHKDDIDSVLKLLSICFQLYVQTAFDTSESISSFLAFLQPEYLLKYDMTDFFSLLVLDPKQVSKCLDDLFYISIESQTFESFSSLVNKYDNLFTLFAQHFNDNYDIEKKKKFLRYLILSFPYYTNTENAKSCLFSIIVSKEGYRYTDVIFDYIEELAESEKDITEILSLVSIIFSESRHFLQESANCKVQFRAISYFKKFGISGQVILDFLSSMAQNRFDPVFDRQISEELEANNYFDMNSDQLLLFALGLKQDQDISKGHLCFPSLLGICSDYKFTDLYDLWVCGEVGLSAWLKNSRKSIDEFPSIVDVACTNMKLENLEELFEYPSLFSKICEKIEKYPSIYLFKKHLSASFSAEIHPGVTKSIAFWFKVLENELTSQKPTTIFRIGITDVNIINDQVKIESSFVYKIQPQSWTLCIINFNNNDTLTISFNASNSRNFKPSLTNSNSILFGGKNCEYNWSIGGYIRFFNEILSSDKPMSIKSSGVCSTKYFNEYKQKIATLNNVSSKVKIIVPYSLWNYVKNVKGSLDFIFKQAVDYAIQDDQHEEAKDMIRSLCYLTAKNIFARSNEKLALFISILFNLSPEVIDADIFSEVIKAFEKNCENNGKFDWESFLIMFSDNFWLLSHLRVKVISALFNLLSKYPIENDLQRQSLIISLSSIISVDEFDHSLKDAVLEIVEIMNPEPQLILCLLTSYPKMLHSLSDIPTRYEMESDDRTIKTFIQMFARTKCTKFTQYYLLTTLPDKDSVLLATALLQMKIDNLETEFIIDNCYRCFHIPEAWMNLLFLCTKKWFQLSTDDIGKLNTISLSNFDMNYADCFMKMISILSCCCFHMKDLNFWVTFALILIEDFAKICHSIPEKVVKQPSFKYSITQLMTFGKSLEKVVLFPPIPQSKSAQEALPFLETRGSHFKEDEGESFEMEEIELTQKPDLIPNLLKCVMSLVPKEISIRGNSTYPINQDYLQVMYDLYYENQNLTAKNWNDMIVKSVQKFENVTFENNDKIEYLESNPLYKAVIRLLSAFVAHFDILHSIILNGLSILPNSLYICARYQIVLNALSLSQSSRSYKPSVVNLACESALCGWFNTNYVKIVSNIFTIISHYKEATPPILYSVIIFGFDVIESENIPEFMQVISSYKNILVNPLLLQNVDVTLAFLGKILTIFGSLPPDSFLPFLKHFSNALNSSDSLIQFWGKTFPRIPLRNLLNPISLLAKEGVDAFIDIINDNSEHFKNIEIILANYLEKMHKAISLNRTKLITNIIESRVQNTEEFINFSEKDILNNSHKFTFDHTLAATLQTIFKKVFVFRSIHSIRERELFLSTIYKLKFNNSRINYDEDFQETKRKSISLLSDPVYPTRRLVTSSLDYNLPQYPDGSIQDILDTTEPKVKTYNETNSYPKCISDLFIYPYDKSRFLLAYSPYQIHLRFIQYINMTPQQNMCLLQILLNQGKQFNFVASCSILYGIDTLYGIFLSCDNSFLFIEGVKLPNKNEIIFEPSSDYSVQCFYRFMIMSGYFGKPMLYRGHLVMKLNSDELIYFSQHYWLHKPYSFALNFLRGFNFVLNLNNKKDFRALGSIFKKAVSLFFDSAPPHSFAISPINSIRLLSLQPKETANKWINGEISTYTYLCLLNRFGKRLTCDMTQYPVFPWILSDYTSEKIDDLNDSSLRDLSLPIGQINKERAIHFDETYESSEHEYFYGSHYMHFGVVTYYLFRVDPYSYVSFIFHKGWDHPARMFIGVQLAWKASIDSSIDIKEIVPQFFTVPEIFENVSSFPLTPILNSSQKTDNVELPNWASNPRDFTKKMLQFLEDIRVSSKINNWVDLIFGEKARGQSAIAAKNLFPSYCYAKPTSHTFFEEFTGDDEDNKEDDYVDDVLKAANAIKIMNFGQCPQQLFTKLHPTIKYEDCQWNTVLSSSNWQILRSESFSMPPVLSFIGQSSVFTSNFPLDKTAFLPNGQYVVLKSNKVVVGKPTTATNIFFDIDYDNACSNDYFNSSISVSSDGLYLCIARNEGTISLFRLYYSNKGEVKSISLIHTFETEPGVSTTAISSEHFIIFASNDKTIYQYDIGLLKELNDIIELPFTINRIEIDEIAALILVFGDKEVAVCSISGEILVIGSTGEFERMSLFDTQISNGLADEFDEMLNIHLSPNSSSSLRSSSNNSVSLSSTSSFRNSSSSNLSPGSYSGFSNSSILNLSAKSSAIFRSSANSNVNFNLTSSNGNLFNDNHSEASTLDNIRFDTVEAAEPEKSKGRKITAVALSRLPEHFTNRFFILGYDDGSIDFWTISFSGTESCNLVKLRSEHISVNPIMTISVSTKAQRMIVGTQNCIRHLEVIHSNLPPLKKEQFAAVCINCKCDIRKNAIVCSKCGRFVCQKCCKKDPSTLKSSYVCSICLDKQDSPVKIEVDQRIESELNGDKEIKGNEDGNIKNENN